jgi:gliding motility-associated-like protein
MLMTLLLALITDTSLYETAWHWDLGDGIGSAISEDTSYAYAIAGTYQVELIVYNALGCSDTAWQTIEVEGDDDNTVFPPVFPTAFTPNNDGLNDVFYVRGGPFSEFELRIFNEWGNEIFISTDAAVGWDGKFKDTQQPDGVYIYVFVGTTADGSTYSIQGEINLVR